MMSPRGILGWILAVEPNYPFPPLSHWSDVTFIRWYHFSGPDYTPLSPDATGYGKVPFPATILMAIVTNEACVNLFEYLFTAADGTITEHRGYRKGRVYFPQTDDYAALLVCPNTNAVVRLLNEHKQQFGVTMISEIRVWLNPRTRRNTPATRSWAILYKIKAVEVAASP